MVTRPKDRPVITMPPYPPMQPTFSPKVLSVKVDLGNSLINQGIGGGKARKALQDSLALSPRFWRSDEESAMIEEAVPGPDRLIPGEPKVSFVVPFNGFWCPIADHSAMASRLLEHYLNTDTPEEEILGAAILVSDGKSPWNMGEHSERLIHTVSWLSGATALLDGETSVFIGTGEFSAIQAMRRDNLIILDEQSLTRQIPLPAICFELRPFAYELAQKTQVAVQLVIGLKQLAQKQMDHEKALADSRTFERRALEKARLAADSCVARPHEGPWSSSAANHHGSARSSS